VPAGTPEVLRKNAHCDQSRADVAFSGTLAPVRAGPGNSAAAAEALALTAGCVVGRADRTGSEAGADLITEGTVLGGGHGAVDIGVATEVASCARGGRGPRRGAVPRQRGRSPSGPRTVPEVRCCRRR
jgi:hypothetical protein